MGNFIAEHRGPGDHMKRDRGGRRVERLRLLGC